MKPAAPGRSALLAAVTGLVLVLPLPACLSAWDVGGPWACGEGDTCPDGFTCDDGLCCDVRGGQPQCPTLPLEPGGNCPSGQPATIFYEDRDGDGAGNAKVSRPFCKRPVLDRSWVAQGRDCDDTNPAIFRGAVEVCNGRDDNCDDVGDLDEGLPGRRPFYRDEDGDGFGVDSATTTVDACVAPPGYVDRFGDCEAFDPSKFPGAPELCNNVDDDCDGTRDTSESNFADTDVPGVTARFPCNSGRDGVCAAGTFQCVQLGGEMRRVCAAARSAAQTDRCDFVDDDCDGAVDEQPSCGGPPSLTAPGLLREARTSAAVGVQAQSTGCLAPLMNPGTWDDGTRTWTAANSAFHLFTVEAPAGTTWDLSRRDLRLRVRFTVLAGSATAFGDVTSFGHPVVYLCGEQQGQLMRYVANSTIRLVDGTTLFDRTFVLGDSGAYTVGRGSGFDTTRVKRVEFLISSLDAFTIRVEPETGFLP